MGLSRQEHWSELPFLPPGDLLNPAIQPGSPALQAGFLPSEPPGKAVIREVHKSNIEPARGSTQGSD